MVLKLNNLNKIILADCMDIMATIPDKYFGMAIVDPPYGIGDKFKGGNSGKMNFNEIVNKEWDNVPDKKYFDELFRVSKNQIIWGGNYFDLPPTRCFIIWDKKISEDFTLAMCELAWTSFDKLAKIFRYSNPKNKKIHPTEKPVALYRWLLQNYAKAGDKIIDTHSGSGSLACACHLEKFDFLAIEKDEDYFKSSVDRLETLRSQGTLF